MRTPKGFVVLGILLSFLCIPLNADESDENKGPRKGQESYRWMQQGVKFFDATSIDLRLNFQDPTDAKIVFDENRVWYDDFGDWYYTLRRYPPTECQLTRIPKKDPGDRRLYRVVLPEKFAKDLPEGQEMRLSLSAPEDPRKFVRLLLVKLATKPKEKDIVEHVANFRQNVGKKPRPSGSDQADRKEE